MLEGSTITLRLFAEADLEPFHELITRMADRGEYHLPILRSLTEYRKQFGEHGWWGPDDGRMLIVDKSGRMLGVIGYFKVDPHMAGYEIGYNILKPADRGKGTMTAALRIFSAYLFELKPIARLQIVTSSENAPARRVAEKCGYKFEGVMRQFGFLRGRYHDCDLLSLTRDECSSPADALQS